MAGTVRREPQGKDLEAAAREGGVYRESEGWGLVPRRQWNRVAGRMTELTAGRMKQDQAWKVPSWHLEG